MHDWRSVRGLLILAGLLLTTGVANAHGFRLDASAEQGKLRLVAAYDTDEPAEGAAVTVTSMTGEVVASGLTDRNGIWTGDVPPGEYRVRADDGFGHSARLTVFISATGEAAPTPEPWPKLVRIVIGLGVIGLLVGAWAWRARRRVGDGPRATDRPAAHLGSDAGAGLPPPPATAP